MSYRAAHQRLVRAYGKASDYECQACGEQAHHWSYDGTDVNAIKTDAGTYSHDHTAYRPLCAACNHGERSKACLAGVGVYNHARSRCLDCHSVRNADRYKRRRDGV